MERLRKKDAEEGIEARVLTDEQKAAIAEVRSFYDAKLAQQDIMHQAAIRKAFDPAALATLEEENRREREHLISERDSKLEKIRTDRS
jgi:hypothetical protein